MSVRLVAYDMNKERRGWLNDRNKLLAHIKKTWAWAKLSESAYAIQTQSSASAIKQALRQYLDDNDTLYVITLARPMSGWGFPPVNEWLVEKLGPAEG
ncbi:hypothetical protein [Terricaulis silvestris]|uniref:Uncharacterized protein n=1 Tax=Terricaulis silvestris TaxID=2686094 RepID=A0A6I6MW45_9CAUL|nr:hypothetical protein [Terricaulis silvestris]QGZ96977.1 hypothetical protein DSM104635_03842 [Terricaulis silvestris]